MKEENRFIVKKNTLPYLYQWAVVDTQTGNKVGEYKTSQLAKIACNSFMEFGLPNQNFPSDGDTPNAWDTYKKRMQQPDGNPLPKPPKHSNKRPIELD